MVDLLLEHFDNNPNCDVNAKDFIGYTPLHVAVELYYCFFFKKEYIDFFN